MHTALEENVFFSPPNCGRGHRHQGTSWRRVPTLGKGWERGPQTHSTRVPRVPLRSSEERSRASRPCFQVSWQHVLVVLGPRTPEVVTLKWPKEWCPGWAWRSSQSYYSPGQAHSLLQ